MITTFLRKSNQAIALVLIFTMSAQAAPTCVNQGQVCNDATPCKTISGITFCLAGVALPAGAQALADTCWNQTDTYTCDGAQTNTCQPFIDQGCGLINSQCDMYLSDGVTCGTLAETYQCVTTPPVTSTNTTCGDLVCSNGQCFKLAHPANGDMAQVAAMMELARQAGNYQDPATLQFFKGTSNGCEDTLAGMFNCCTIGAAGGQSNASVIGGVAINVGSYYVMDALAGTTSSAPSLMSQAYGFFADGGPSCMATPGSSPFSVGGVSVNFAAGEGESMFAFDPTSLAIMLAIIVIEKLLTCTQDEQMLSVKRGNNLCIFTDSYCAASIPIINICLKVAENFCCYNSILARVINEQGWAQLGLSLQPSCAGFTQAQLSNLDFSKMNLSEFMATITSKINIPAIQASMQTRITSMANSKANTPVLNPSAPGGYTGGFKPVLPP
jgi:conjugal transfer mating pair stabilization protein TraN